MTQWELFQASGGTGTAIQNVASIVRDPNGAAGPAGSVYVATQNPEPRLGRLDPDGTTNNYTQWRPLPGTYFTAGAPVGLALNQSNGDIWIAMQGVPSLMVKFGGTDTFRRFDTTKPLTPQGVAVDPTSNAVYVALPTYNAYLQGEAIMRVPRDASGSTVNATTWDFQATKGMPEYVAVDGSGNIWFTDSANNIVGRLNPATNVSTEWKLPAGTNPIGLYYTSSQVCVVSDGLVPQTGAAQCLDPSTNQFTTFAQPVVGLDRPQQLARNSYSELFVTEWNGNSVVFIGQNAYQAATVTTVTPTTTTRKQSSISLSVQDVTTTPTAITVTPTVTTVTGTVVAQAQTRYALPTTSLTYPNPQTGYPQPFGITAAFNDFERGSGTAFIAEYFSGPIGTYDDAIITKIEVVAPRVIDTTPSSLTFDAIVGQPAPAAQQVAITEDTGLSLNWTATSNVPWMTVSPASGAAPSTLTVNVDPSQLTAGTYTGVITVDDGAGGADPKNVAVTLNVAAQPSLAVSPSSLSFSAATGATPASQTFQVTNTGGATLAWTAAVTATSPAGNWLHVQQTSGTAPSTVTVSVDPQATQGTYTGTITVTASGALNSPGTVDVTFVVNNGPPQFALAPGALTFSAAQGGAAPPAQAVTVTNAGGQPLNWSWTSGTPSWITVTPASGTVSAGGSATISLSANQSLLPTGTTSGTVAFTSNASSSPQLSVSINVTASDTTPPVLALPSPITAEATGPSGAAVTFSVSATDNVDTSVTVTCSPSSGSAFPLGTTTVNCSATDSSHNTATGSFTVTVSDTTPPVLTVPAAMTVEATGPSGAAVTFTASATDLVAGTITPSCTPGSGTTFPITTTTVTCTATDGHNSASKSFTITVRDTTPPTLSLPASMTVQAVSASGANVTFSATATDIVSGSTAVACSPASGSLFPVGTTTVSCSSTDSHGNSASGTFSVTVTPPPVSFTTSPTSMIFQTGRLAYCNGIAVGPNWKSQGAILTNTGTQSLNYSISTGTSWIAVSPATGTVAAGGSLTLVVSVDLSNLSKGTYTGSFTIAVAGATAQTVPVTLNIGNAPATLCLSPTFINFGGIKSGRASSTKFNIENVGDDPLGSWTIATSATHGTVTTNATSGSGAKQLSVTVKTDANKGTQSGTVTVSAPTAVQPTQTIALTWSVS